MKKHDFKQRLEPYTQFPYTRISMGLHKMTVRAIPRTVFLSAQAAKSLANYGS